MPLPTMRLPADYSQRVGSVPPKKESKQHRPDDDCIAKGRRQAQIGAPQCDDNEGIGKNQKEASADHFKQIEPLGQIQSSPSPIAAPESIAATNATASTVIVGTEATMRLVAISRNAIRKTDAKASNEYMVKPVRPGLITTTTPRRPIKMAVQRRQPTSSLKISAPAAAITIGTVCSTMWHWREAIGSAR